MATYQSQYTGQQIDAAVAFGMSPDATPTQNSTKGVTSGGVYAETSALKSAMHGTTSEEFKEALLNILQHVVYTNDQGSAYINTLRSAMYDIDVLSITATFDAEGNTIYVDEGLTNLRQYLTVVASYEDGTSTEVSGYTLLGSLHAGNCDIVVSYGGKSTTVTIPNVVDFYNIFNWEYNLDGTGNMVKTPTSAAEKNVGGVMRGVYWATGSLAANNRRGFAVERGVFPMLDNNTEQPVPYYPVPVPATATKFTASITPNTCQFFCYLWRYTGDGYTLVNAPVSWKTGQQVQEFTAESNLFVSFNCRYNSSNVEWPANDEPEMSLIFE